MSKKAEIKERNRMRREMVKAERAAIKQAHKSRNNA